MSLSKPVPLCKFCDAEKGIYMCPRCNIRYCSAKCYKDVAHERCTEMFFQEWVMSTLQEQSAERTERDKMLQMLKDSMEQDQRVSDSEDIPIEDRFSDLNLEKDVEEKIIWDRLNGKEKADFLNLLKDEDQLEKIIPVKIPWWAVKEPNLVTDAKVTEGSSNSAKFAARPPLPIGIKKLSEITDKQPSNTIPFNIINVLSTYAFLMNFHNNEMSEFVEEVIESVIYLCPVISQKRNYMNLEESVQDSIRLILSSSFEVSMKDAKAVCFHVCSIIEGARNAQPNSYVLCALNDLKTLILNFHIRSKADKSTYSKGVRQTLQHAVKKIDYFLSWTVEYYEAELKPLSTKLQLLYYPELLTDDETDPKTKEADKLLDDSEPKKVLIEEMN